jgi:hypothetical protein
MALPPPSAAGFMAPSRGRALILTVALCAA